MSTASTCSEPEAPAAGETRPPPHGTPWGRAPLGNPRSGGGWLRGLAGARWHAGGLGFSGNQPPSARLSSRSSLISHRCFPWVLQEEAVQDVVMGQDCYVVLQRPSSLLELACFPVSASYLCTTRVNMLPGQPGAKIVNGEWASEGGSREGVRPCLRECKL